jgi:hypothetical protein
MATAGAWLQTHGIIAKVVMVQKSQIEPSILRHIFLPGYILSTLLHHGVL